MRRFLTLLVAFALTFCANGQSQLITTAVPFLSLENNARVLARGNLGVVAPRGETATAFYSNPALIQTDSRTLGVQATYMPWLRALVGDISLVSLDGSYQLSKAHAIGVNLRYFSLGKIQFIDQFGNLRTQFTPNEFCGQVNYAIKLNEHLDAGLAGKFVSSNLTGGQTVGGASSKPGITGAVDIGAVYRRSIAASDRSALELGLGGAIVNLGPKISYTGQRRDFIPTQLNAGSYLHFKVKHLENNEIDILLGYQASKLLVPTPPIYERNEQGAFIVDGAGNFVVAQGMDPNVPVVVALYQSFYDAPRGFPEEVNEINHRIGLDAGYRMSSSVRGVARLGYFYEAPTKGNRQYFTAGVGASFKSFYVDVARIFESPFREAWNSTSLGGTMCYSLGFQQRLSKRKSK